MSDIHFLVPGGNDDAGFVCRSLIGSVPLQEHQLPVCTADDEPVRQEQRNSYDEKDGHGLALSAVKFHQFCCKTIFSLSTFERPGQAYKIKMASFVMKNATPKHAADF
jgi:hypothetical protein